jgi:hypothetical protein
MYCDPALVSRKMARWRPIFSQLELEGGPTDARGGPTLSEPAATWSDGLGRLSHATRIGPR